MVTGTHACTKIKMPSLEGGKELSNQMKCFFLLSIIFIFLSSCVKKDNLRTEEKQKDSTEMSMTNLADENYSSKRNELLELVKKVPYPDEPEQIIHWKLKQKESFLLLEEHSDELLDYALDFFQDETLTYSEKKVIAYVLLGVDFEKYKYFLRDLVFCFLNGGNLDDNLVGFCIYPGYPELGIRGNFEDPVIKEVVESYAPFVQRTYRDMTPYIERNRQNGKARVPEVSTNLK